jgi:hypothetical protein
VRIEKQCDPRLDLLAKAFWDRKDGYVILDMESDAVQIDDTPAHLILRLVGGEALIRYIYSRLITFVIGKWKVSMQVHSYGEARLDEHNLLQVTGLVRNIELCG